METELLILRITETAGQTAVEGKVHDRRMSSEQMGLLAGMVLSAAATMAKSLRQCLAATGNLDALAQFDIAFESSQSLDGARLGARCRPAQGDPHGD